MFAAFGSEHTGFEIAQIAHWFAAEHHGYHNDQQYRCGEGIRRHDADKSLRRHFGERFEVQIVRVADRRQHTAHIRADGHQRGHQYGLILLARHDKHRNSEWHERDQGDIVGDEHRGEERQCHQGEHQPAHGGSTLQQTGANDAEDADALKSADYNHQANQLADGAGMDVHGIFIIRRYYKTRNQCKYCGNDKNRFIFGHIDQPTPHSFLHGHSRYRTCFILRADWHKVRSLVAQLA